MKRSSNKNLNHENWDQAEEVEDRGQMQLANKEVISNRKVISAKRKPTTNQASVFKSFGGFTTNSTTPLTLSKDDNYEKHINNLKELNKRFLENIEKCISENNCCILSPILEDYQKHLTTIRTKYPLSKNEVSLKTITSLSSSETIKIDKPTFGTFNFTPTSMPIFSKTAVKEEIEKPLFSFANTIKPTESSFGVFGVEKSKENSCAPSSLFGNGLSAVAASNDDEEEYVPPKAETRDVKESDSFYDIRCKLFYQVNQSWKDKGVGNLFLKPASNGQIQLVMRADNTLGTILLNALINKSMPLTANKNNVNVVLMTDFLGGDVKPTPLLIRVKTEDSANELIDKIKKYLK